MEQLYCYLAEDLSPEFEEYTYENGLLQLKHITRAELEKSIGITHMILKAELH